MLRNLFDSLQLDPVPSLPEPVAAQLRHDELLFELFRNAGRSHCHGNSRSLIPRIAFSQSGETLLQELTVIIVPHMFMRAFLSLSNR